ncbi:CAMK/CDPK protein kinase [Phytophthora nicotianae P10297]|uniref:CAMK/CDPK protein kinase n=2 Tax=Phytophthora nicotianae TaxID=4792 RepID=W3A0V4_PHYNI|nr:CAMK/CDPK protein kinase [Phytophthora nicotianae]ETP53232.1 CAMK/CDPK protein kinase [Phytophthora nicotianae P10297]
MSTSQLRFRRKIGNTMYGEVLECELHPSKANFPALPFGKRRIVAVKCMSLSRALDVQNRCGASRIMDDPIQESRVADLLAKNGGHRNVVASYFHFQENRCLYLVGEFCTDGDLYTHLASTTGSGAMDERQTINTMRQIFSGVDYLHRVLSIAHRDLSLENVLINQGECKISDFGLSVDTKTRCTERVGKEYYMAPEVVAGEAYDPVKADIWSLGIMWFILLTGSPLIPIASRKEASFLAFKRSGVVPVFKSWGVKASSYTMNLVDRMLKVNPSERISLEVLVAELNC